MDEKIKNFYKNKKILITGVTGFKGSWLALWLKILGSKVYGIGYNPNKNKNLFYQLQLVKKINLKLLDVRNKKKLDNYINKIKPQIIFHLAAQPLIYEAYEKPFLTYEINAFGTLNLLEICRKKKYIKSVVCVTSDKCYKNNFSTIGFKESDKLGGADPYSGSKACAEIIANTYLESFYSKEKLRGCGLATARAGNVIGGGDWSPKRLIPDVINSIINKKIIFLRNPKFNRPWQHVLEPLFGYLKLGYKLYENPKKYSGAWNFGTKKNTITNVQEIVEKIINFWGYGKVKVDKNPKFYEQENLQLNISKAIKHLGWRPKYSITESVKITTEWYKKVKLKKEDPGKITTEQINDYMRY